MTSRDIAHQRLINQRITGSVFSSPEDIVRWMGCIQAQDFAGGKWAIGIRGKDISEADIDRDFNAGKILRTHILRPTWHFVSPSDIRWLLRLTAPKIKAFNKSLHRKLGIDDTTLSRSKNIISKALTGGNQLTRAQLLSLLKRGRINTDDIRSGFLLMDAELDGIICSGARQGKQSTYALLDERVPISGDTNLGPPGNMAHDAAIAELTHRYFASRGPATLQDFSWWSGLNLTHARKGIGMNEQRLTYEVFKGEAYWFPSAIPTRQKPGTAAQEKPGIAAPAMPANPPRNSVYLLPGFDEYAISYKDRSALLGQDHRNQSVNGLKPTILINGQIAGTWKQTLRAGKVLIETTPGEMPRRMTRDAAAKYARFVNKPLVEELS